MVRAIEPAVRLYEEPPTQGMLVETPWSDVWLSADDWAEAFESPDPGTPHNEARDQVWDELLTILADKHDDDVSPGPAPQGLGPERRAGRRLHPRVAAARLHRHRRRPVVGAGVPPQVRPWLEPDEVRLLRRPEPHTWTVSDLPLLDAARQRLGDREASGAGVATMRPSRPSASRSRPSSTT